MPFHKVKKEISGCVRRAAGAAAEKDTRKSLYIQKMGDRV